MSQGTKTTSAELPASRSLRSAEYRAPRKSWFSRDSQLSTLNSVKERGSHGALRSQPSTGLRVALLTGGGDKPYALGMAAALTSKGIFVDFIGSDDLSVPEVLNDPRVNFLNLRGDQRREASMTAKALRVLKYYVRLIIY